MADLEHAVSSFMKGMITTAAITLLNADRRALIARWAVKTVMNFELQENSGSHYFSDQDRHDIRQGGLPARHEIIVWAARYNGPRPYAHNPIALDFSTPNGTVAGRVITMIVGRLVLQILVYPAGRGVVVTRTGGPWQHRLIQVYPIDARDATTAWPPTEILDDDGVEALARSFLDGSTKAGQPQRVIILP